MKPQPKQLCAGKETSHQMAQKKKKREAGSGTIVKRSDGRWQGQYVSGRAPKTGKLLRYTIYGKTQKEVAEKLRAATSSIDNGTFQEPRKITLKEYACEYLQTCAITLAHHTQQSYKRTLKNHILPALGNTKLTDLTHRQVQTWIASLSTQKQLSAKTVRNIHGILHSMLEAAVRDEILLRNVSEKCKLPRVTQTQVKAITTAELGRFLQAIENEPFRNIFFIDIFSGLRLSEILGLRWNDIDWDNGCLYVRQQLMQNQERGNFSYFLAAPKEGKQRKIILANTVLGAIQKQHTKQLRQRMAAGALWDNQFDLVFTNDLGRPLNRRTVYKHLKRVLRDCGMGDYTFHSLRHSFATISLENGDDIKTVQANLGHYAASFTLKTYVHVSDQMQRNSAARMEELIASLPIAK